MSLGTSSTRSDASSHGPFTLVGLKKSWLSTGSSVKGERSMWHVWLSNTTQNSFWPKTSSESGDVSVGRRNSNRDGAPGPGQIQTSLSPPSPWHPQELLTCSSNVQHHQSTKALEMFGFISVGNEVWAFTLIWFHLKNLQEIKLYLFYQSKFLNSGSIEKKRDLMLSVRIAQIETLLSCFYENQRPNSYLFEMQQNLAYILDMTTYCFNLYFY